MTRKEELEIIIKELYYNLKGFSFNSTQHIISNDNFEPTIANDIKELSKLIIQIEMYINEYKNL